MKCKHIYIILYILVLILPFIFIRCKDIVEEDLSEETVTLLAPANGLQTETLTHNFWWDPVDGADRYNLQIVEPSFSAIESLVMDTNLSDIQFQYTLDPGSYEWGVSGYNSTSATPYTVFVLQIDSTPDLSGQEVVLESPSDNKATSDSLITFKWYELYNAEDYRLEIRTPDWDGQGAINPQIIDGTEYTVYLEENFYTWGIQAQNSTSGSSFTTRDLIVDRTAPNKPVLLEPDDEEVINDSTLTNSTITFQWKRGMNSGSAIHDSLYLYSDSTLTVLEYSEYLSDTVFSYEMDEAGDYYWFVRSIDAADNESEYSSVFEFIYEE